MQDYVTVGDLVEFILLGLMILGLVINWHSGSKKTKNGNDVNKVINLQLTELKEGQKEVKDNLEQEMKEVKKELKETKTGINAVHINCAKTVAGFTEQLKNLNKKVNG